jgi:hypothetical protein
VWQFLRRIAKNAAEHGVGIGWCSVFRIRTPDNSSSSSVIRFIVDDEAVVLPLDQPSMKERRFASLLIRDCALADNLVEGFQELWRQATKSLQEISVDPRRVCRINPRKSTLLASPLEAQLSRSRSNSTNRTEAAEAAEAEEMIEPCEPPQQLSQAECRAGTVRSLGTRRDGRSVPLLSRGLGQRRESLM